MSWKLEAGSWKLEAGSWKLEAGSWKLEAGSWKLEAGSQCAGWGQNLVKLFLPASGFRLPFLKLMACSLPLLL
ncbi:hypothetical protein [Stutzerimonas stutzeri]|uniref:hypothetical protein n=1 Tax=Stutzerimonas stutzeri TaxID=316 RepID=UPI001CFE26DA|nr:hypothetical protein [Stutzerimonas stutzeri]